MSLTSAQSRIADQGEVACLGVVVAEGGVETVIGPNQTQAVGADEADAILLGHFHDTIFQPSAGRPRLAKAGGENDHRFDTVLSAGLNDGRNGLGRCGDHGQIDGFADRLDGLVGLLALNLFVLRIDRIDGSFEAG